MTQWPNKPFAQDVCQGAWWLAIERGGFDGRGDFVGWLQALCKSQAGRQKRAAYNRADLIRLPYPESLTSPTYALLRIECRTLMDQIPNADHRDVAFLRYIMGFDVAEISELRDVPRGTVDVWLFRARKFLIENLKSNTRRTPR